MGLQEISAKVAKAENDAGRAPGSVELIAVSKVQPNARVAEVLSQGHRVVGIDNMNDYYDVSLKESRAALLDAYDGFRMVRLDLEDRAGVG